MSQKVQTNGPFDVRPRRALSLATVVFVFLFLAAAGCSNPDSGPGWDRARPVREPGGLVFKSDAAPLTPFEYDGTLAPPVVGEFGGSEVTIEAVFRIFSILPEAQAIVSSAHEQFVHLQAHAGHAVTVYTDAGPIPLGVLVPSTNEWHHVVLKARSGDTALFLDGRLLQRSTLQFTNLISTEALRIGRGLGEGRNFVGPIRSIALYPNALEDTQIEGLYSAAVQSWPSSRAYLRPPTPIEALAALALLAWVGRSLFRWFSSRKTAWPGKILRG